MNGLTCRDFSWRFPIPKPSQTQLASKATLTWAGNSPLCTHYSGKSFLNWSRYPGGSQGQALGEAQLAGAGHVYHTAHLPMSSRNHPLAVSVHSTAVTNPSHFPSFCTSCRSSSFFPSFLEAGEYSIFPPLLFIVGGAGGMRRQSC